MDNMLKDFLVESYENLDQVDQDFVSLEQAPDDLETLASIFRTIHTIKGSCGFFGYSRLETLAHNGENLLGLLREGKLQVNDPITTTLLEMIDQIRAALADIEENGQEGERDFSAVIAQLQQLQDADSPPPQPEPEPAAPTPQPAASQPPPQKNQNQGPAAAGPVVDDIVRQFLDDSYGCLERLDQGFIVLEEKGSTPETLAELAAAATTLADGCAFMGLEHLAKGLQAGTALLEALEPRATEFGEQHVTVLLDLVAAVGETLATVEATGDEGDDDWAPLIDRLNQLQTGMPPAASPQPKTAAAAPAPPRQLAEPAPAPKNAVAAPVATKATNTTRATAVPPKKDAAATPATGGRHSSVADNTIRVDVALLDRLMNQVGELVLARNQILQRTDGEQDKGQDKELATMHQRLSHITSELQESIMLTRLQPIDTIWNKLPRIMRDLSREVGKQIQLVMEGGDTELDKTLIEAIKDPMTHLVRNAVDHGVETPEERLGVGKAAEGTVTLRAYHEGGQVNIEIMDDGKGIDGDKVLEKVLEKGLLDPEQARHLSERDKFGLIFLPGLSTAAEVTNISGRGVGMDVVKSNIDRINGLIDIQSELGRGTHIKLKIPLTLAIIPALIVGCAGESYAIPQMSLISVVSGEAVREGVEILHHVPVYRWRGKLLPLVYLQDELGLERATPSAAATSIIVLQAENREFGLIVDQVNDTEEIVVKPLGQHLRTIPIYAGATIRGDGMAALILDVLGLAQSAAVVSELGGAEYGLVAEDEKVIDFDKQMVLLVRHKGARIAIPISRVPRLEKFSQDAVEYSGTSPVVQYRGSILRLKDLNGQTGAVETNHDMINVVVCNEGQGPIGLIVDEILDIVEERFAIQRNGAAKGGIIGTAVIQEKVVEVLDVDRLSATPN
jgi:two-component system, chemotaxis family, sensor kinase CheA